MDVVEYALLAGLVALVCVLVISNLGLSISESVPPVVESQRQR